MPATVDFLSRKTSTAKEVLRPFGVAGGIIFKLRRRSCSGSTLMVEGSPCEMQITKERVAVVAENAHGPEAIRMSSFFREHNGPLPLYLGIGMFGKKRE